MSNCSHLNNDLLCVFMHRMPCTLGNKLQSLANEILGSEQCVLEVRRTHILKDAMKEARKSKFNPKHLVKVNKI